MIDPRASVDPRATLEANVSVGPYTVIGPDVYIGAGTWIGPHVVINGPTRIGAENRIFQFASIGDIPQDKKYAGEASELIIGNRNTIREYCTINRGTLLDRGKTTVGNDNWIMAYVHVAHDCQVGSHTVFANGATLAGHVEIGDYAVLGGFTLVHQHCRVGVCAFCGMGTALNRDLPPYVMASGNLAKSHGLNKEGLRRQGFDRDVVRALHKTYMGMVKSKSSNEKVRTQIIELAHEYPEVANFVEFIKTSKRGIVK